MLVLAVVGGMTIWSSYRASVHEVDELFDAQLSRSARLMLGLAITEIRDGNLQEFQNLILQNRLRLDVLRAEEKDDDSSMSNGGHSYELKLAFQVWDEHGNLILHSGQFFHEPLTQKQSGYSDSMIDSVPWRVFSMRSHDLKYLVMTAERYDVRSELIGKIITRLLMPFLLMLPLLAWLLWLVVGRGLQILNHVADEVRDRDLHNLSHLDDAKAPDEVKPLVQAINRLFERVNESFEKEKRFTADAAHELRTPLAALKTHAQLARSARTEEDRQHALQQLEAGVERARHLVDQLLTLARIAPEKMREKWQTLDLHALALGVVAEQASMAADKNIDLSLDEASPVMISGQSDMLRLMLRNLLDNAIRYTPDNGQVAVKFDCGAACISIHDSGTGIVEADYEKVFDRFYRGDVSENGCGIGLSIVKQVADMHGIKIFLGRSPLGGLHVELKFPSSTSG